MTSPQVPIIMQTCPVFSQSIESRSFFNFLVEPTEGKLTNEVDQICMKIAYEYKNFVCADNDEGRLLRICMRVSRILQTLEANTFFVTGTIAATTCIKRDVVFKDNRFPVARDVKMFHCPARKAISTAGSKYHLKEMNSFYITSGYRGGNLFVFLDIVVDGDQNPLRNSVKLWNQVNLIDEVVTGRIIFS
jgi:hypothetical protein